MPNGMKRALIGVMTALIGTPFFIYLARRKQA